MNGEPGHSAVALGAELTFWKQDTLRLYAI